MKPQISFHVLRLLPWALAVLLLCAQNLGAQAATPDAAAETQADQEQATPGVADLKVAIEPNQITVGGRIQAEVTLVWMGPDPAATPRFPTWQDVWGDAEVLTQSEVNSFTDQSGRQIYRQQLELTSFQVGEGRLPTVTVAVPLSNKTHEIRSQDPVDFTVTSVLPEPATEDNAAGDENDGSAAGEEASPLEPKPAAGLQKLPPNTTFLWTMGILTVCFLLTVLLLLRRWGQEILGGTSADIPLLPPLEEFLQSVDGLDPSLQHGEPAHTGLSLALRRFLGRQLAFQAVESTTSEIQKRLRATAVGPAMAQRAIRLLRECDQVKFGRLSVPEETTDQRLLLGRGLARDIEEALKPAEEPMTDSGNQPSASANTRRNAKTTPRGATS